VQGSGSEGVNAKDLLNGDPKAVFNTFKSGVETIDGFLKSKQLTGNLVKLAKVMSALSFAMPIASIALDFFIP